jgi:hypothetical protein
MPALGLGVGEVALGSSVYELILGGGVRVTRPRQRIIHQVAGSAVHPQKELGGLPAEISFTIEILASDLLAALGNIETKVKRKLSYLAPDGTEVYYFVHSGEATTEPATEFSAAANVPVEVKCSFTAGDQRLYRASDDAVLLGA